MSGERECVVTIVYWNVKYLWQLIRDVSDVCFQFIIIFYYGCTKYKCKCVLT